MRANSAGVEHDARVVRGEARRVVAVDRVERLVCRARRQIVEHPADPGQQPAAALQRLDRVREIGRFGGRAAIAAISAACSAIAAVEGRREMLRPDAVERRQSERRVPGLQKRVVGKGGHGGSSRYRQAGRRHRREACPALGHAGPGLGWIYRDCLTERRFYRAQQPKMREIRRGGVCETASGPEHRVLLTRRGGSRGIRRSFLRTADRGRRLFWRKQMRRATGCPPHKAAPHQRCVRRRLRPNGFACRGLGSGLTKLSLGRLFVAGPWVMPRCGDGGARQTPAAPSPAGAIDAGPGTGQARGYRQRIGAVDIRSGLRY